ncbi:NlpC/P60 family protein [Bermanella sp. R86510]|uniref:NlpC/P60 family protein n=1 Tax=unclassified Bermanella TaxID=2627862 RepID=UPI0037C74D5D
MNFEKYLTVPYIDGGRDVSIGVDCWGMVRHVLHEVFDKPLLESFSGITRSSPSLMTAGYRESVSAFSLCKPKVGAVACCFYSDSEGKQILHHVGLCINDHQVLHTSSKKGADIASVRAFKRLAADVRFYEYIGSN